MRDRSMGSFIGGVVILASIFAAGCASTSLTPFVSPDYDGKKYSSIMVVVDSADLALRQQIEKRACRDLSGHGTSSLRAIDLFFPGKEYSTGEMSAVLSERHVEAVLVLTRGEAGYVSSYVPKTYNTTATAYGSATTNSYASGSATRSGNTVYGSASGVSTTTGKVTANSRTTESGGYNVNAPWARFRVNLVDVETGSVVWTAQGNSSGNGYNDQEDLWQSLSDTTVSSLRKGGFLAK